jgi:indole-3-glycerol phosphate synthase
MSSDFLADMASASRARVDDARARMPEAVLQRRVEALPGPPSLRLQAGFDLIAELKLRSPASGLLSDRQDDLETRVVGYADAGAALVSVLTEPARFDGSLTHLSRASAVLTPRAVPAMRKDFITDSYQLLEARLAGAAGVLLIVRMLEWSCLQVLVHCAHELGLFVLLEAFDASDIDAAAELATEWRGRPDDCLIGVNSRDLRTLEVVPERLELLAGHLPRNHPRVAESGLVTASDAARLAEAGYTVALVGSALMSADDPQRLAREMIAAGRAGAAGR